MKKMIFTLFALFVTGMPGYAGASGHVCASWVDVGTNYMRGTMSIRYNATPTAFTEFVSAYGYVNSVVHFYGRDGAGDTFSCYVPTTSALYAQAMDVKNNLKDGSLLYAAKGATNECTAVYIANHSCYQH